MYKTILVTLENTAADRAIVEHVKPLATLMSSRVVLIHVATGWAAKTYGSDAVSPEISEDTAYLQKIRDEFRAAGIPAEAELAFGEPPKQIVKMAEARKCDLIAMTSHGHKLLGDLVLGSTIHDVRHSTSIPVLLVRAEKR
jgi:nucleotide-binding universal stress UspA family protein